MSRQSTTRVLALLAVLFAFYGSIVPIRLREDSGWALGASLGAMPFEPVRALWTGDFVVNALIFLPIGFFATGSLAPKRGRPRATAIVAAVSLCACLAVVIEISQIFLRDRTSSWSDVLALSIGGLVGAVLWTAIDPRGNDAVASAFRASPPGRRMRQLFAAYCASWIAIGLLPLLFPRFAYPLPSSIWLRPFYAPSAASLLAAWLHGALAVAPIGAALALSALRSASWWRVGVVWLAGGALVLYIDRIGQITPGVPSPDVLPRLIGLPLGAWFAHSRVGGTIARDGLRPGRWPAVMLAGWCALVVLLAWAPFDFGIEPAQLDLRVRILYEREPFYRYYWAPPLMALNMALTQLLLAAPVGGLLCLQTFRNGRSVSLAAATVAATTFFAVLEWGQLHLPGHRADPTDVMVAAAGAFFGAKLAQAVAASAPPLADDRPDKDE